MKFVLNNPPSSGDCSTSGDHLTVTQATGGRERFGYICGTNSGQHSKQLYLVYLPLTIFRMED